MDLFFSYARADSDFALRLAGDMRSAGVDLWMDQLDIPIGARWDQSVENALRNSPRLLIVLSPASVASENVMDEVAFAIEQNKTILPVLYRTCEIPFRLRRLQYLDFMGDYDTALTKALGALHAAPPQSGGAPSSRRGHCFQSTSRNISIISLLAIPLVLGALGVGWMWTRQRGTDPTASNTPKASVAQTWNSIPPSHGIEKPPLGVPEGQPWVVIGKNEIVPVETSGYVGSNGYRYAGEGVKLDSADNMEFPRRSRLLILENGKPLGPSASSHADIQAKGEGRYSHWSDEFSTYLYFSTSDNSDPRHNRRTYVVTLERE